MKKAWIGLLLIALLLIAVPAAAGPLGEGFYFTSGLVDIPRTDLLEPRGWQVRVAGFYDRWGEPLDIKVTGGNVNKDLSLSLGITPWLQAGIIMMATDEYAGQMQLRLFEETPHHPALCLGALARLDKSDTISYLVAGKHNLSFPLLGKANLYGGVGALLSSEVPSGPGEIRDKLQGIFMGIEKTHRPRGWKRPLTLMIESDAKDINIGLSYELFRGLRLNGAITNVENFFGEGDPGVALVVQLSRAPAH